MNFSLEEIKDVLARKQYQFFDSNKPYNLNIIGIRSLNEVANEFDVWLYLIYRDTNLNVVIKKYDITTDPGTYWLKNPNNVNGTAILCPGQYKGSHQIGLHQGRYKALKQKAPLVVWRDNTRDNVLDKSGKTYRGIFGINIHRSSPNGQSRAVEKWSAGCQVFKRVDEFNSFMDICEKAKVLYGNSFTYTLLEEEDFR